VEHLEGVQGAELEREMFILRKLIEKEKTTRIAAAGGDPADFYICTMSNRTIVYKVRTRACRGYAHKILVGQKSVAVGTCNTSSDSPQYIGGCSWPCQERACGCS